MGSSPSGSVLSDFSSSSKALESSPSLSSFLINSPRDEYRNQHQTHNTNGVIDQHHKGKVAQLTEIDHPNQFQQHTTIGSTNQHDSNKFKSPHDIAPVVESYGLRQRRGRETQWHFQNENIDGFQEPCHTNDGSWQQNAYNLDEQNEDEEEDDGDDDDGGKSHKMLHMNAHNERGKHAKNPNNDDDDDDDGHAKANANDNGDDDEREGNQKSPSPSSSIQKEDVSSSSSSSNPHSWKDETRKTNKKKKTKKKKKKKKLHDYMCCRCASRFTVDCAAVCCCPLALVHLAALTFIRLPASLLWRMLVNLKSRMCVERPPTEDVEFDEGSSVRRPNRNFNNSKEDEGLEPSAHHIIRFESQKLWQHFGTGDLDFGGFTMRGD